MTPPASVRALKPGKSYTVTGKNVVRGITLLVVTPIGLGNIIHNRQGNSNSIETDIWL